MKIFKDWNLFEKTWLTVFVLINIVVAILGQDTLLGLIASVTGIICVVLVAKGKTSNYLFGIINVALYGYISYSSKYYGEAMLNLIYFLPMQFVGIWIWLKNKNTMDEVSEVIAERMSIKSIILWSIISIIGIIGYGMWLNSLGNTLPYADSFTTILSVVAMILMVKRYIEQWVVWIFIDIVSIYMWFFVKSDYNITVMWIAYLINAFYGLYNWIVLYNKNKIRTIGGSIWL